MNVLSINVHTHIGRTAQLYAAFLERFRREPFTPNATLPLWSHLAP